MKFTYILLNYYIYSVSSIKVIVIANSGQFIAKSAIIYEIIKRHKSSIVYEKNYVYFYLSDTLKQTYMIQIYFSGKRI